MSRPSRTEAVRLLGAEVARRLDAAGLPEHAADLRAAAVRAADAPAPGGTPADLPVLRRLPEAMDLARHPEASTMAGALDPLLPLLRWGRSSAYVAAPPNHTFLAGYGHATLLGSGAGDPVAIEPAGRLALGLLLLGPRVDYPGHRHPADEVYLPLTPAHWSGGTHRDVVRGPGDVLHHTPGTPHAMRTGESPLLAVYLWRGDITTPARFVTPP